MSSIDLPVEGKPRRLFATIRRDAGRYFQGIDNPSLLQKIRIFIDTPGLQAVMVYRFGNWINRKIHFKPLRYTLKLIHYILQKLCIICWGIFIDDAARIGPGLYVGHFGGVIIGPIDMGSDCNVAHQVTIGQRVDGVAGVPVIGNQVWIGTGSVIFGNVRIGDGVTIGPQTVVSRSLPARLMVIGNPMRVLRKEHDNHLSIYGRPRAQQPVSAS